ncbi:DUF6303 family protein [Streptomyces bicolor]|uniref:DUF6303 family protein n=1 Tax=Streptomyces bicolor TaxID=66874 RepID=UPI0004E139A0|nr:DUF6303 family protein [Streptomyces bicolor]
MKNLNHRYEAVLDIVLHHFVPVRWELSVGDVHVAGDLEAVDVVVTPTIPTIHERERLLAEAGFVSALHPDYDPEDGQGWKWREESPLAGVPEGVIDLRATLPVLPIAEYAERGSLLLAEA